jgi:hypothetical protein
MEARVSIYSEMLKVVTERILQASPDFPKAELESLSLAALLNILFLLRGEFGSIGEFGSTVRALRHLVGDQLFWQYRDQKKAPAEASPTVVQ